MTSQGVWICQKNIERFRSMHSAARDEQERALLSKLLAQEETTLKRLESAPTPVDQDKVPIRDSRSR